jgi:cytochrome P450/ferredoxin-NADP reductase
MSAIPIPAQSSGCRFAPRGAALAAACPVSAAAAEFDPFEDNYQQCPPEYARWSREAEPIFYSPKLGYWVVTRYEEIKAIFRDNITFSPSIALEKITPTGEEANKVLTSYGYAMNRTLVNEDEPAHMPRRRLLMEPFTPAALTHHEPMVRRLTREYVDRFIDDGKADLVNQMLWEVPLTVALHFLGVPEEDMDTLRKYSIAHTVNTWGRPKPEEQVAVAHAVGKFWQFAGTVLEKMRRDPSGPGWMKYGIRMQAEHPDIVTDSYLHSMMMAGIVAAHETTANASANAIKLLLEHRQVWREICDDPSLIPNAVEECLRHNGSIAAWRRLVTKDVQISGIDIPAGSKLLIVMASANHDERHFADADAVDIRRDNATDHLTFGYGSHQCLGNNLARMEIQIFLQEFTRRLPHMKLSPQKFTYLPNTSFRGPEHLWVEWEPQRNPERNNPALREQHLPIRIGEPSRHAISRPVLVDSVTRLSEGIVKLRLVSPDGRQMPRWSPGSHIDVECGTPDLTRQYSLCGDPADANALEIAVLHETEGRGGSVWIHDHVRAGDRLTIRGPRNHFRFDEALDKVIFIAGGIGITPISSMARRAKALGMDYELHYSGRTRSSMVLLDELAELHGDRLHVYVSDEGRRNDLAALLARPIARAKVYACGPVRMLHAIESCCAGWPEDSLRIEHFVSTTGKLDPSKEQAFEVELKYSGIVLEVPPDRTVLQVLRAANFDIRSNCEEGLCGTCEVRVLAGKVDHRDVVLTQNEREAHTKMMTCCSRARGSRLVLEL